MLDPSNREGQGVETPEVGIGRHVPCIVQYGAHLPTVPSLGHSIGQPTTS